MRTIFRRVATGIVVAFASTAIAAVATPAISAAEECEGGRTWVPETRLCDPPPPAPAWYQAAPSYAQSWAPAWTPPPPPTPPWMPPNIVPVWSPVTNSWTWFDPR